MFIKMDKKRYNTILFDVDGTLLDFEAAERTSIQFVLNYQGVPPTKELEIRYSNINSSYWKRFEKGEITREQVLSGRFEDFFETLGIQVDGTILEKVFRSQLDTSAVLLEGAMEICQYLKGNYDMYVVTNGVSETQYRRLAASHLDRYFDDIFVSEDAKSQKPQKEYFDYCFSRITDADPERMLIIGDSLSSDIKGGNTAKIDTCWMNPGKLDRMEGVHVDYEIRQLKELKEFL